MEFSEVELHENREEMDAVELTEIDSSFQTHFMKLEEILRNKNNREKILKEADDNLQTFKKILIDQTAALKKIQEENQCLSLKIKYENQWRDKIIKRMIETYDKLKIVTSSTNLVKSTITFSENNQEQINQGKQQLMERISFNKEKNDLKYEHLMVQHNLLSKDLENEKLNMNKFEKQFEIEIDEVSNKINLKKQSINDLKMKIQDLKTQNELLEKRTNATTSEDDLILKEIEVINFKTNMLQETMKKEMMESDEKINSLKESIEINNKCINELEKNTDAIKEDITNGYKILDKMNKSKSELNQNLSNLDIKCNLYNNEIDKVKEIHDSEAKKYNTIIIEVKQEVNEKQKQIMEMEKKNSILKEDHHALVNQIMSLESSNNQLDLNIVKLNEELNDKHLTFDENKNNFEKNVIKLEADIIQEKDLNKNIENEIEILENEISDLNIQQENEKIDYDNVLNEVSMKEINLNLEIDKLKETKHVLQTETEDAKAKIKEVIHKIEELMEQAQNENDTKIKNLEEQTNIYQKEIERVHQVNEEKRKQKLYEIKQIGINLKDKITECQANKQNLDKELAARIKELGKIRAKKEMEIKEKKEDEFIEEAEKEMMEMEASCMMSTSTTKKPSMKTNDKKIKFDKEGLPNLEIPVSKYSSTSFSNSSICSLDSTTLLKRKLQKQKRPRQTLPFRIERDTQMSLDEIFNSLRNEQSAETVNKKPKTRVIQKSRKTIF